MSIEVAVIPAAGRGTRMRPFTRTIPKPLLPVLEKPVIQYVVEEAVEAGINEIIFVIDSDDAVLRHFTVDPPIPNLEHVSFTTVEQKEANGLGDAVLQARQAVGDRPFAVLLSDMFAAPGKAYLRDMTALGGENVVAVQHISDDVTDRWGIVDPDQVAKTFRVRGAVEKPGIEAAASNLGLVGRYLFSSRVFDVLENLAPGWGGEIQLTDAIDVLARTAEVTGVLVDHPLLDAGIPIGLARATVEVSLARPDLREAFEEFLRETLS